MRDIHCRVVTGFRSGVFNKTVSDHGRARDIHSRAFLSKIVLKFTMVHHQCAVSMGDGSTKIPSDPVVVAGEQAAFQNDPLPGTFNGQPGTGAPQGQMVMDMTSHHNQFRLDTIDSRTG